MKRFFYLIKKAFHEGTNSFLGGRYRGLFYIDSTDQIMREWTKSFTNIFSSNLNSLIRNLSPAMVEYLFEVNPS